MKKALKVPKVAKLKKKALNSFNFRKLLFPFGFQEFFCKIEFRSTFSMIV